MPDSTVLTQTRTAQSSAGVPAARDGWGHVLVGLCACILTVTILGSAVYLGNQLYQRHLLRIQVRAFVSSLENRTPDQLAERAAQLAAKPKVAKFVLPELLRSLGRQSSEQQLCSTIQLLRVFLDDTRVEKALLALRKDPREDVAATAVEALALVKPPQHAAELLGVCLEESPGPAVVDSVCGGLVGLGAIGADEMRRRAANLSIDRRVWLVGYIESAGSPDLQAWWTLLSEDPEARVRDAARRAMGRAGENADRSSSNHASASLGLNQGARLPESK